MCQLLGMNCNVPTDICFSFTGFQARGGLTDHHTDGWGITFFEGKGVRQFLDPNASAHSPVADFIRTYPIKSKNVIAHIRKATFNFLLSNGEFMMAHCSTRLASIVRKAPFTVAHLKDQEVAVDFSSVTTANDRVAVIATNPLTENETWTTHAPGTLLMFVEGEIKSEYKTIPGPVLVNDPSR